ncbi:MAG: hypothetical protein A2077_05240 [Nitrospirae bacterium GWC2_46_6]|nr:MAG: hypothetical protein A2077_05240 [Nitrospirae bacterium GWC2_46_6]OGW20602.1 MAG: hypothetical protein A2Z82_11190 [Nitrospirae bacterium GWA2_46_11]OGW23671.1 MAG: hypothetical protein A2X55_00485 [Nitrospirae bacterium GWB2_47_37]HAK89917.1 hypothetical protein [Nitrospiraceae bacterium]HCZ11674.1 hypothetical protein [Nitrospiraceae bacterium]
MKKFVMFFMCAVVMLWAFGSANAAEYAGSDSCFKCHPDHVNDWKVSGHPYKLQKAETAKSWMLPLPKGYSWDDISYVIGGAHKKSRYMDKKGYIITMTGPNKDVPGKNQYNLETGTWGDYHPGEKGKKYDCGRCHTTGYKKEGHQDGLEGITGTWAAPGIQCEACHGPASDHVTTGDKSKVKVDKSAALCGQCHVRGDATKVPAGGGFIKHHETYPEILAGVKKNFQCVTCHNPHKRAKFSIKTDCSACHTKQAEAYGMYKGKRMHDVGIKCIECHMPKTTKSATAASKTQGDIRTHVFKINTDPKASMFYDEEVKGKKATFAKGFVTLDFACLNCHKNKDMKWAAEMAKGIHKK